MATAGVLLVSCNCKKTEYTQEMKEKGSDVSFEEILENVKHRDYEAEHRAIAPLRKAPGALLLDNSRLTPEQQMEWFLQQFATIRTDDYRD